MKDPCVRFLLQEGMLHEMMVWLLLWDFCFSLTEILSIARFFAEIISLSIIFSNLAMSYSSVLSSNISISSLNFGAKWCQTLDSGFYLRIVTTPFWFSTKSMLKIFSSSVHSWERCIPWKKPAGASWIQSFLEFSKGSKL